VISWKTLPIRIKLTLWHTLLFGCILLLFIAGSLAFFYLYLLQHQDAVLKEDLEIIQQFLYLPLDVGFRDHLQTHAPQEYERFAEIWSGDGRLIYRSPELEERTLGGPPTGADSTQRFNYHTTELPDGGRWRVVGGYHRSRDQLVYVRLAVSEEPLKGELYYAGIVLGSLFLFLLLLVAVSGYLFAGRMLKPVELMSSTAARISAKNLEDRLPVLNPRDEFGLLATTFNNLLERVSASFTQLKRFASDASHELRTPLTALRSVGEVGLQSDRSPAKYREIIGSMLEENERLTGLVDKLLFLSRADHGNLLPDRTVVKLPDLVVEIVELMGVLAEEKSQTIVTQVEDGCEIAADRGLLRQAILDLVDNAIRYGPVNSSIRLSVSRDPETMFIDVADQGPGIPPDQRELIFDRFYRLDESRSRQAGGTGLGLSIVRWIVSAHGGSVSVLERTGPGSVFRISLPLAHQVP